MKFSHVIIGAIAGSLVSSTTPSRAGTNVGNYKDGKAASSAFCRTVDARAWSYVGGHFDKTRDAVRGDFDRASLEVGGELEALYAERLPADMRLAFRSGWKVGMKECAKIYHF